MHMCFLKQHWVLVVINRVSQQLFYFDSLKNGNPNKYPIMKEIYTRVLNIYKAHKNICHRSSLPVTWTHVKVLTLLISSNNYMYS
ncbi:putative Ulp1 protease family catalytic domain-containing protein [Lupinus albus]|uniref:Putative Ulp1 protease family catalytic domain-containing protein n=1 Tax=Lupinus albus TaxID=3870 RepID=A0A6A4PHG6_LUPAL|nr:putative Ulp1 protease family catalytic domain-containing protein [Lupinus albus]